MSGVTEDITAAYGHALVAAGQAYPEVVVLDADIADSCMTEAFARAFPDRAFDLGVAEQSLPTFAAGLALVGKIPFCNSFAVFAVSRGVDMIRQSVAYNRANVKLVGHAAGQSMGYTGPTHHSIEDFSLLRAIPGLAILSPCDATEARQMVWRMAEQEGPVYLRLTRGRFRTSMAKGTGSRSARRSASARGATSPCSPTGTSSTWRWPPASCWRVTGVRRGWSTCPVSSRLRG